MVEGCLGQSLLTMERAALVSEAGCAKRRARARGVSEKVQAGARGGGLRSEVCRGVERGLAHGGVLVFLLFTGHWRSLAPRQYFETKHNRTPFQYCWFGKWLDGMQAFWPLSTLDVEARSSGNPSPQQRRGLQLVGSQSGIDVGAEIEDLKLCFIMFSRSGLALFIARAPEKRPPRFAARQGFCSTVRCAIDSARLIYGRACSVGG